MPSVAMNPSENTIQKNDLDGKRLLLPRLRVSPRSTLTGGLVQGQVTSCPEISPSTKGPPLCVHVLSSAKT